MRQKEREGKGTHFFPPSPTPSHQTSTACFFLNVLMNLGSHSSEAIPRSLQHLIKAFDLAPSEAVAIPWGLKYSCSPLAVETNLRKWKRRVLLEGDELKEKIKEGESQRRVVQKGKGGKGRRHTFYLLFDSKSKDDNDFQRYEASDESKRRAGCSGLVRGSPSPIELLLTHLPKQTKTHSLETILVPTLVSPLGASPHPPGPKALLRTLRYLISGR